MNAPRASGSGCGIALAGEVRQEEQAVAPGRDRLGHRDEVGELDARRQ